MNHEAGWRGGATRPVLALARLDCIVSAGGASRRIGVVLDHDERSTFSCPRYQESSLQDRDFRSGLGNGEAAIDLLGGGLRGEIVAVGGKIFAEGIEPIRSAAGTPKFDQLFHSASARVLIP